MTGPVGGEFQRGWKRGGEKGPTRREISKRRERRLQRNLGTVSSEWEGGGLSLEIKITTFL